MVFGSCLVACLLGCLGGATTDDDSEEQGDPTRPFEPAPGPTECTQDRACEDLAYAALAELSEPAATPGLLGPPVCREVAFADGTEGGPTCRCPIDGWGNGSLGPVGLGCFARGRGGECLFDETDFAGCNPDKPASCDDACELLYSRVQENAKRIFDTEVLDSACVEQRCRTVIRIGNVCFPKGAEREFDGYDCNLGAEGILEAHAVATQTRE